MEEEVVPKRRVGRPPKTTKSDRHYRLQALCHPDVFVWLEKMSVLTGFSVSVLVDGIVSDVMNLNRDQIYAKCRKRIVANGGKSVKLG